MCGLLGTALARASGEAKTSQHPGGSAEQTLLFCGLTVLLLCLTPGLSSAATSDDNGWHPSIPVQPIVQKIVNNPKDTAAIRALVAGEWRVIATYGFGVLAKDAPEEVLGKTGRIVLDGKDPKVLMFEYGTDGCTPAKAAADIIRWLPLEIPPTGYNQIGWSQTGGYLTEDDTALEELKSGRLKTWNGKPLSAERLKALEPIFSPDFSESRKDSQWLLIGFANRCEGKRDTAFFLEPTRGGMLIQYYVDGFLIYQRIK